MRLGVDRSLCEGHGQCVAVDPDSFELDDEMTVLYHEPAQGSDVALLKEAVMACPSGALTLEES